MPFDSLYLYVFDHPIIRVSGFVVHYDNFKFVKYGFSVLYSTYIPHMPYAFE